MFELTETNAAEFLVSTGWLSRAAPVRLLAGGVSNVVLYVDAEPAPFVVKQSRPQLRTKDPWYSSLDRVYREADAMRALRPLLGQVVPEVLFEDREHYLMAMTAAPAGSVPWKTQLLAGRVDPAVAVRAGRILATLHGHGIGCAAWRQQFADARNFHELRLEPYYLRLPARAPDLTEPIDRLVAETTATRITLVHADYSPKNMLIAGREITLVDYETVHFGDPAFDLGFLLAHLVLKTIHAGSRYPLFLESIRRFWDTYLEGMESATAAAIVPRSLQHLAANLLVRIDGTSPVDYLTEPDRQMGRGFARWLFRSRSSHWREPLERLEDSLRRSLGP